MEDIRIMCRFLLVDISNNTKDVSNTEIPQKFSRLPPQLEKIGFFGVKS
jgi:hypothetical protein